MSISALEQGDQSHPIWALNGAASSEIGQPGEVHVGIPKVNGGTKIDDLYLPQTWLPCCLTDQIPRHQLLSSSEFRNAVNTKLIILITAAYAENIQKQEGAAEEQERLTQMRRAVREATGSRTIQQSGADVIDPSEQNKVEASNKKELSSSFVMFINSLEAKSDLEAMNAIRSRARFSRRELSHAINSLNNKPKTRSFLIGLKTDRDTVKKSK